MNVKVSMERSSRKEQLMLIPCVISADLSSLAELCGRVFDDLIRVAPSMKEVGDKPRATLWFLNGADTELTYRRRHQHCWRLTQMHSDSCEDIRSKPQSKPHSAALPLAATSFNMPRQRALHISQGRPRSPLKTTQAHKP